MVDIFALLSTPERPRLAALFVLVALVATALFVPTFDAYVAVDGVKQADTRVTDASVGPDEEQLLIDLRFENPTRTDVTVLSGQVRARDGDTLVTRIAGTDVDRTTVPAGETATIRIGVTIDPSDRDRAIAAANEGRLWFAGFVWVTVGEERIKIQIRPQKVADDEG